MVSEQLEQGMRVKDSQKVAQVKEWGWGGEKRRETLFPCSLPSPPFSFFGSCSIFRVAKTENPHSTVFICSETKRRCLIPRLSLT